MEIKQGIAPTSGLSLDGNAWFESMMSPRIDIHLQDFDGCWIVPMLPRVTWILLLASSRSELVRSLQGFNIVAEKS